MPELCIHGHFYQPPRIDPWLEEILPEGAAAPFQNWNERIAAECYGPLAHARRLNSRGEIFEILNCYEWISFNFGPTLLHWMQRHSPALYARILDADRRSADRLGHGSALAQCYHHAILPLSGELDRALEVQWSIQDFERRFGRPPEGIWLPETAVDTPTLETLASSGIRFTILAPRQAEAVAGLDDGRWQAVEEHGLDTSRPYLFRLPSGRSIALFFYNGQVSRAVAFEGLLSDGEAFWQRLTADSGGFRCIATDGESYGHHFKFGEMALAYLIDQARSGRDGWGLTNFGAALASTPPQRQVRIRERSSWSCIHGVGRWSEDCGCTDGGHPGWHQKWRAPLRRALEVLGQAVDRHLQSSGKLYFPDTRTALVEFGRVLSGELSRKEFLELHCNTAMTTTQEDKTFALLSAKRWALAAMSSCAWFFDDIGRLEPLNGMTFALRSIELLRAADGPDIAPQFAAELEHAASNDPAKGNGAKLWREVVLGRRSSPEELACLALGLDAAGGTASARRSWPGASVTIEAGGDPDRRSGTAMVEYPLFSGSRLEFALHPGSGPARLDCSLSRQGRAFPPRARAPQATPPCRRTDAQAERRHVAGHGRRRPAKRSALPALRGGPGRTHRALPPAFPGPGLAVDRRQHPGQQRSSGLPLPHRPARPGLYPADQPQGNALPSRAAWRHPGGLGACGKSHCPVALPRF
jgi:hypothetical protein